MKNFTKKLTGIIIRFCILTSFVAGFHAAKAQQYKYDPGAVGANTFPFNATAAGSNRVQWIYNASNFLPAIPAGGGIITNVYYRTGSAATNAVYTNLKISFMTTAATTLVTGPWNGPMTQAFFSATYTIPSAPINTWVMIPLQTPWLWNGSTYFIMEVQTTALTGTGFTISQGTGGYRLWGNYAATTGTAGANLAGFGFDMVPPIPCAGKPIAGFINPVTPCPNTNFNLSLGGAPLSQGSGITYEWQKRVGTAPFAPFGPTSAIATDNINVPTDYRCIIRCSNATPPNDADTTPVYTAQLSNFLYCYCIPTYSSGGTADNIVNVRLGPINNPSTGNNSPYYSDYSSQQPTPIPIAPLTLGMVDTVHVTFGTDPSQYCGVWIDFNRNGLFDISEFITTNANAGASGTLHIPIATPGNAQTGLTRMRIRGGDDVQCSSTQPCGPTNSAWGETEDYLVEIRYPNCTGPADPGVARVTDTAMCPAFPFIVTDTTHTRNAYGLSWVWQSSITSGNIWNDVTGSANKDTLMRTFSNTIWYRMRLICSVTSDTTYSNIIKINIKPPYKCYCYSAATGGVNDTSDIGSFSIGTFHTTSGGPHLSNPAAVKGRTDYTDLGPIELYTDSTYTVDIFHTMSSATHADGRVTLFIDYNNNLQYDIPDEAIYLTTPNPTTDWQTTSTLWYLSNKIHTSYAAIPDVPTGMRVIINNDIPYNVPSDLACGPYVSGETEDYNVVFRINDPLSVHKIQGLSRLAIYPNPNNGFFNVSFSAASTIRQLDITVRDITGRILVQKSFTGVSGNFKQEIDLSNEAKGMYFVEIKADGQKQTSKVHVR